jgi:urea transport system permease protein
MVIAAAVGGRISLFGAVYGSLLVNFGKTYFSESFPELWLFLLGGLFIAVVMVFPDGLAGVDLSRLRKRVEAAGAKLRLRATAATLSVPSISSPRPAPCRPGVGVGPA